mmetsp:Transcript_37535/g.95997  ORF Transcript_37535/g.95997 Transcript_37535/m.95997 type:complete len:234 (-) Transcript_37535:487-1188(-)
MAGLTGHALLQLWWGWNRLNDLRRQREASSGRMQASADGKGQLAPNDVQLHRVLSWTGEGVANQQLDFERVLRGCGIDVKVRCQVGGVGGDVCAHALAHPVHCGHKRRLAAIVHQQSQRLALVGRAREIRQRQGAEQGDRLVDVGAVGVAKSHDNEVYGLHCVHPLGYHNSISNIKRMNQEDVDGRFVDGAYAVAKDKGHRKEDGGEGEPHGGNVDVEDVEVSQDGERVQQDA